MEIEIQKPRENWTKFPNSILDNLYEFEPMELMVVTVMVREQFGKDNPRTRFPLAYLEKRTGKSRHSIINALRGLEQKKAIQKTGTEEEPEYYLIITDKPVQNLHSHHRHTVQKMHTPGAKNAQATSAKNALPPVQKMHTLKDQKIEDQEIKNNRGKIEQEDRLEEQNSNDPPGKTSIENQSTKLDWYNLPERIEEHLREKGIKVEQFYKKSDSMIKNQILNIYGNEGMEEVFREFIDLAEKLKEISDRKAELSDFNRDRIGANNPTWEFWYLWKKKEAIKEVFSTLPKKKIPKPIENQVIEKISYEELKEISDIAFGKVFEEHKRIDEERKRKVAA